MNKPDARLSNMVAWVKNDLRPYIKGIQPAGETETLGITLDIPSNVTYLYVVGRPKDTKVGFLTDEDLHQFGSFCVQIIMHFHTNYLWTPNESVRSVNDISQITKITHQFCANRDSLVWQNSS